jgi:hypothetical protein
LFCAKAPTLPAASASARTVLRVIRFMSSPFVDRWKAASAAGRNV